MFGGREEKYQNAADLFSQAANAFKMQQSRECAHRTSGLATYTDTTPSLDQEAGQAFEKAAQIQLNNLKEPDDAANTYVDAFKAYRKISPEDAVRCLDFSINHYCSRGNFRRAASHKETLGEVYEVELGDQKHAMESYENAATWYEGDGAAA